MPLVQRPPSHWAFEFSLWLMLTSGPAGANARIPLWDLRGSPARRVSLFSQFSILLQYRRFQSRLPSAVQAFFNEDG